MPRRAPAANAALVAFPFCPLRGEDPPCVGGWWCGRLMWLMNRRVRYAAAIRHGFQFRVQCWPGTLEPLFAIMARLDSSIRDVL